MKDFFSFIAMACGILSVIIGVAYLAHLYQVGINEEFTAECVSGGGVIQKSMGPRGLTLNCVNKE